MNRFFIIALIITNPSIAQSDLRVDVDDALMFTEEVKGLLERASEELRYCKGEKDLNEAALCLIKVENRLNSALESVDDALYDIEQSVPLAEESNCQGIDKPLSNIVDKLNSVESSINLALERIRSGEQEENIEAYNEILQATLSHLDDAEPEIEESISLLKSVAKTIKKCNA